MAPCLILLAFSACSSGTSEHDRNVIEYRLVVERTTPGAVSLQSPWSAPRRGPARSVFFLGEPPVVSDEDFRAVEAEIRDGRLRVSLEPTPSGAISLQTATGVNVGEQLALLLMGHVVSTPVIRDTIRGGNPIHVELAVDVLPIGLAAEIVAAAGDRWRMP